MCSYKSIIVLKVEYCIFFREEKEQSCVDIPDPWSDTVYPGADTGGVRWGWSFLPWRHIKNWGALLLQRFSRWKFRT